MTLKEDYEAMRLANTHVQDFVSRCSELIKMRGMLGGRPEVGGRVPAG